MASSINMSLDDLIKVRNIGRGGRNIRSINRQPTGVVRGRVDKRNSFGNSTRPAPDQWKHDMYNTSFRSPRQSNGIYNQQSFLSSNFNQASFSPHIQQQSFASTSIDGKLLISNLDFGVNDTDIIELFSEFGKLTKASVHYDRSGRSIGTAEVWFDNQSSAVNAMNQYNNVPLDGRPMMIQLVGVSGTIASVAPLISGVPRNRLDTSAIQRPRGNFPVQQQRPFNNNRIGSVRNRGSSFNKSYSGRGGSSNVGRGRGGRFNNRDGGRVGKQKTEITKEDLDAELDNYREKA